MDVPITKPLGAEIPINIDFAALPLTRLEAMEAAAFVVLDSQQCLAEGATTVVGEVLKGQGAFVQWDHYPAGDVYDWNSHSQYYFHAHPPDRRANVWGAEHGHFHTFMRAAGMPPGTRPADIPGNDSVAETDALSHIVALSMNREGQALRLFTTNRWVTGEQWYAAEDVIALLDRFEIDQSVPSRPVNEWITNLMRLFRPQIEELLRRRDAALADWQARFPKDETTAYDDRDLEVTSVTDIDVADQIERLAAELEVRRTGAGRAS
mgnify:CR=1 FL=1